MDKSSTDNLDLLVNKNQENLRSLYEESDGVIVWNRPNADARPVPLCNFTARILYEEIQDDGAERTMKFVIEIRARNGQRRIISISAEKYAGLSWITAELGASYYANAGAANKDHLRVAIQQLSGVVPQRVVIVHLGWRKVEGKNWIFLYSGGAIGEKAAVEVSPQKGKLESYVLPCSFAPTGELQNGVRESLALLELAPTRISAPLLAAIYRAPLGECLDIDFSLFLSGPSGCQKSELSAICQGHFGKNFKRTNLPGNFASTANSLERQAFLTKDCIFVVDDFAPNGNSTDVARLHKDADRLLRGAGNKAGRERLTSEAKARPQYYPRGLIISSGEDIPRGTSVRARTLILEMYRGDVSTSKLTMMQEAAASGMLATAMAGYIRYLCPKIDDLKKYLPERFRRLRAEINERQLGATHARTPDLLINLLLGMEIFLKFSMECGAIEKERADSIWKSTVNALIETGRTQAEHHATEDSANKFFLMIEAALVAGRAHLADAKTGALPTEQERWGWYPKGTVDRGRGEPEPDTWEPKGEKIGWINGDEAYLNPGAAYACAQEMAKKQNDSIATSPSTLWKHLLRRGMITKGDEAGRIGSKRQIGKARQRVLVFPNKETLLGGKNRDNRDLAGQGAIVPPSGGPSSLSHFSKDQKLGPESGTPEIHSSQASAPRVPLAPVPEMVGIANRYLDEESQREVFK